ncbi:MAG: hypothetical protein ACLUOK_02155 [Parabacteroides distasonis]
MISVSDVSLQECGRTSNCERKADDYLKLLPVSQDAWQVNPNLKQNPGYAAFSK